jgi:hypothetical protein
MYLWAAKVTAIRPDHSETAMIVPTIGSCTTTGTRTRTCAAGGGRGGAGGAAAGGDRRAVPRPGPVPGQAELAAVGRVIAVEVDPVLAAELPRTVAARAPGQLRRRRVVEQRDNGAAV